MPDSTTDTVTADPVVPSVTAPPPEPPAPTAEAAQPSALAINAPAIPAGAMALMMDPETSKTLRERAVMFSASDMVPDHFKGKKENCFIVLCMAHQLDEAPVVLFQNLFFVHGKLGMEAKFMLNLANTRGPFVGGIRFRTSGTKPKPGADPPDDFTVTAYGIYADGEEASAEASIGMAKAEGWYKSNPKYRSMPEQMLCYKSAAMLIRKACPQVTMGASYTCEELQDIEPPTPLTVGPAQPLNLKVTDKAGAADAILG